MKWLILTALTLSAGTAEARWVVRYDWIEPPFRAPVIVQTQTQMLERLCNLELPTFSMRESEIRALRCALRYRR
jgi:hypothetical protein